MYVFYVWLHLNSLLLLLRADMYIIAVNIKEVQMYLPGGFLQFLVDQIIV